MSFTLVSRFRAIVRTREGRKHLRQTWKWTLSQALRAASGQQISDLLHELNLHATELTQTIRPPKVATISENEFVEIARTVKAGKLSGHSLAYRWLDLNRHSDPMLILEVGIGTNDPGAASTMGTEGVPGSSLEMWRRVFPMSRVLGGDVDPKALVQSTGVTSAWVDSTSQHSIDDFVAKAEEFSGGAGFSLIVDDGLHTPESNLRLFRSLVPSMRLGGFYVIEDIPTVWNGFWKVFAASLGPEYEWVIEDSTLSGAGAHSFLVIKRVAI